MLFLILFIFPFSFPIIEEERELVARGIAELALQGFQTKIQGPPSDPLILNKLDNSNDSNENRNKIETLRLLEVANLQIQDLEDSVSQVLGGDQSIKNILYFLYFL